VVLVRGSLEEGQEGGGHQVRADDVGGVDGGPLFDTGRPSINALLT
jgi:hypothetical protein